MVHYFAHKCKPIINSEFCLNYSIRLNIQEPNYGGVHGLLASTSALHFYYFPWSSVMSGCKYKKLQEG